MARGDGKYAGLTSNSSLSIVCNCAPSCAATSKAAPTPSGETRVLLRHGESASFASSHLKIRCCTEHVAVDFCILHGMNIRKPGSNRSQTEELLRKWLSPSHAGQDC